MKRFLPITAAALMALGGSAVALTQAPQAQVNAVSEDIMRPADPQPSTAVFTVNEEGVPSIEITFTTPTQAITTSWDYIELPEGTVFDKVLVNRTQFSPEWIEETIVELENVGIGETLTVTDDNFTLGQDYNYNVVVYLGELASYDYGGYSRVYAGIRPAEVSGASLEVDGMRVKVSATCVDQTEDGEPMPYPLTQIEVRRVALDFINGGEQTVEMIMKWNNPVAGQEYTYWDTETEEGYDYAYFFVQVCEYGESYESLAGRACVGQDTPQIPAPVTATAVEGGALIQWTPNPVGQHNGPVDLEEVEYKVYRYYTWDNTVLVGTVKGGDQFVDNLEGIDQQIALNWMVIASNRMGESSNSSGSQTQDPLIVGPAPELPYVDTFSSRKGGYEYIPDYPWVATCDPFTWNKWAFQNGATYYAPDYSFSLDIYPVDYETNPEDGMAYLYCSQWGTSDSYMTSGDINFGEPSNPIVGFWYYGYPGAGATLSLEVIANPGDQGGIEPLSDDEEENVFTLWEGCIGDVETEGWQQVLCHANGINGLAQLRFHGVYNPSETDGLAVPLCLDQISVIDYAAPADLAAVINEDASVTLTWTGADIPVGPEDPDQPVVERDGTEENPYNIADIKGGLEAEGEVWIIGTIVGSVGASWPTNANFTDEEASNTNIMMSSVMAAEANVDNSVPVQLPKGTCRDELNLQENPGNFDKVVMVKAKIQKYFGTEGIKAVTDYKFVDAQIEPYRAAAAQGTTAVDYVVTQDGVIIANTTEPTYTTDKLEYGTYTFGVMALYNVNGEAVETPESYITVEVVNTGVQAVDVQAVTSVKYFNLQGVEITEPAAGEVVIRRATLANGKTVTEKTVVRK